MSAVRFLHLLRHGEPVVRGHLLGRTDCPVSAEGIAACVEQVEGLAFDRLIASDLARAADCARALGAPVTLDPRWRELDFGAWDGRHPATIDPAALARFWDDPDAAPPPEGERWSALTTRVGAALEDIPPGSTLVVTHGGAMRAALALLCGFDQRQCWGFDLPCAALLSFRIWPGPPRVAQIIALAA